MTWHFYESIEISIYGYAEDKDIVRTFPDRDIWIVEVAPYELMKLRAQNACIQIWPL